jgi:hypothetical protein
METFLDELKNLWEWYKVEIILLALVIFVLSPLFFGEYPETLKNKKFA